MRIFILAGIAIGSLVVIALFVIPQTSAPKTSQSPPKTLTSEIDHSAPDAGNAPGTPVAQAAPAVRSRDTCEEVINNDKFTTSWVTHTHYALSQYLTTLQKQLNDEELIDYISWSLRLDVQRARSMRLGYDKPRAQPLFATEEIQAADEQASMQLIRRTARKQFGLLLKDLNQKLLPTDRWYWSKGKAVFLYQWVLESDLKRAQKFSLIQGMLRIGVPVYASDLAAATEAHLPRDTVDEMLQTSDVRPDIILNYGSQRRSFTTYALAAQSPELTQFWLEQGSSPHPDKYAGNGLDLLSVFHDKLTPSQRELVFKLLYPHVQTVGHYYNQQQLASLLPKTLLQEYPVTFISEPSAPAQDISDYLENMQHILLKQIISVPFEDLDDSCRKQLSREMFPYILEHDEKIKARTRQQHINQAEQERIAQEKRWDALIAEAEALFSAQESIEQHLAPDVSLESKKLLDYYRGKLQDKELAKREQERKARTAERKKAQPQTLTPSQSQRIYELVNQDQWQSALTLLGELPQPDRGQMASQLLYLPAFDKNAMKPWIIDGLLDAGATPSDGIMGMILSAKNLELAKALLPYGLDVNSPQFVYGNPVSYAAVNQDIDMLRWLIANGSRVHTNDRGFDALDRVLQGYAKLNTKLEMIQLLLNAGLPTVESHRQIVKSLESYRPREYRAIIQRFPQLSP